MAAQVLIAPSILAADLVRLGEDVKAIDEVACDWVHVDVMHGHPPGYSRGRIRCVRWRAGN